MTTYVPRASHAEPRHSVGIAVLRILVCALRAPLASSRPVVSAVPGTPAACRALWDIAAWVAAEFHATLARTQTTCHLCDASSVKQVALGMSAVCTPQGAAAPAHGGTFAQRELQVQLYENVVGSHSTVPLDRAAPSLSVQAAIQLAVMATPRARQSFHVRGASTASKV